MIEAFVFANVVATLVAAWVLLTPCAPGPSNVRTAVLGADTIRQAAELWQNLDGAKGACPSLSDLVTAKRLDPRKAEDPWGSPYQIICTDDEVHVLSPGRDRKAHTPDDIHDGMKRADLDRITSL